MANPYSTNNYGPGNGPPPTDMNMYTSNQMYQTGAYPPPNAGGGGQPMYNSGGGANYGSGGPAPIDPSAYMTGNFGAPPPAFGAPPSYGTGLPPGGPPSLDPGTYMSVPPPGGMGGPPPVSDPSRYMENLSISTPPQAYNSVAPPPGGQPPFGYNHAPPSAQPTASFPSSAANTDADYDAVASKNAKSTGTGSGILSKGLMKLGQMKNAGRDSAKQRLSNAARKMKQEDDLHPPPGGYNRYDTVYQQIADTTKFSLSEVEHLYYEFTRHCYIPSAILAPENFVPHMTFDDVAHIMPKSGPNTSKEYYNSCINHFFNVFKWGAQMVTFESFAKAMCIIVRGTPQEKIPMLYDLLMDHQRRVLTSNSMRFVLDILISLQLPCPTAAGAVPTNQDAEALMGAILGGAMEISLNDFTARVSPQITQNQRPWTILQDCMGVFPYMYYAYFAHVESFGNGRKLPHCKPHCEGFLVKQSKGTISNSWNRHWSVADSGFFWYYPSHNQYDEVSKVLYLGDVSVQPSRNPADPPYCFEISSKDGIRKFCAEDEADMQRWMWIIESNISQAQNPCHSFSPIRENIDTKWYVDGKEVYKDMYHAMMSAKEEIMITDWFFSPEVQLIRENDFGQLEMKPGYRLENVLLKKAEENVQIFVLPWSETKIAIDLASANVKQKLESLHHNIKVLCHPLVSPIKWSHHQKTLIVDQKIAFVGGLDLCFGRWDEQVHRVTDNGEVHRFPGKDYYNPGIVEFSNVHDAWTDLLDREKHPRMPWHDIHMRVDGPAARDVAYNFIQRWNYHRDVLNAHKYILPQNSYLHPTGNTSVHVVRSVCDWSANVNVPEVSILNAYIEEIQRAEHFIYIENQFFISKNAGGVVENEISRAILSKVFAAARENRVFRVIIITPVHPEGGYKTAATVRYIMWWQVKTICKGGSSMIEEFVREFPNKNPMEYFHFYCVKNWARLNNTFVAEQIYVHAKLMIVDDRTVICGSANINDRSMLGVRDSEIAVVVKDRTMLDSFMNGQPYKVAKLAHDLRVDCMLEHLGMNASQRHIVADPIHPNCYNLWLQVAKANTEIFYEVFYKSYSATYSPETEARLSQIRGHLVEYDQEFLEEKDLKGGLTDVDVLLTTDDVFT